MIEGKGIFPLPLQNDSQMRVPFSLYVIGLKTDGIT